MIVLDGGRISIGALGLGIAQGAFKASVKYSKEREQFGQPIAKFQGIAFKLAEMATKIKAAELMLLEAADKKNNHEKMTKEGAMAKYYSSEVAVQVSTKPYKYSAVTVIQKTFQLRNSIEIQSFAPSVKVPQKYKN